MNVFYYINQDLKRLTKNNTGGIKQFLKWYILPKGSTFRHDVWFRILQACKRKPILKYSIGLIAYIIARHYEYKYGIHINANIDVGEGLLIVHGGANFLNCKSIGKNVTIYPSVMLGAAKNGIPTIEDDVTIYTGAVVTGSIQLGKGCIIGANAVIRKNCEPNSFYAGVPAKRLR